MTSPRTGNVIHSTITILGPSHGLTIVRENRIQLDRPIQVHRPGHRRMTRSARDIAVLGLPVPMFARVGAPRGIARNTVAIAATGRPRTSRPVWHHNRIATFTI